MNDQNEIPLRITLHRVPAGVAFAFFINGPPNWQALEMVSKLVAAVARY